MIGCLKQHASRHADRRIRERLEQLRDEVGGAHGVVVDEDHHVGVSGCRSTAVHGPPEAEVLRVPDDGDVGKPRREHLQRVVGRGVVDDDDVNRDGLGLEARDGVCQQAAGVPRRDDDDGPHATRHDTRVRRVVMWSTDPVGEQMAGPGIRYHRLSTELAGSFDVTLVAPGTGIADTPYVFRAAESVRSAHDLEADVVVAQSLPLGLIRSLRRTGAKLVFDLYAPALVEAAANIAEERGDRSRKVGYDEVVATTRVALLLGDAFLCASERQRDHWLGALAALGRLSPEVYADDPALHSLVAVVPFGLDPAPPGSTPRVKGVLSGIGRSDRLLLWGGGIWNWLDPLTVIRAVGRLAEDRSDVRLLFLGMTHPSSAVEEMSMADRAVRLAEELELDGRSVFFNRAWVPYEERLSWFAEADLGVSAHRDSLEARLAFRTRVLDHIACGTPLVVTRGDVLADLVESRGHGPGRRSGRRRRLGGGAGGAARRRSRVRSGRHRSQGGPGRAGVDADRRTARGAGRPGRLVAPAPLVRERRPAPRRGDAGPLVARAARSSCDRRRGVANGLRRRPALG